MARKPKPLPPWRSHNSPTIIRIARPSGGLCFGYILEYFGIKKEYNDADGGHTISFLAEIGGATMEESERLRLVQGYAVVVARSARMGICLMKSRRLKVEDKARFQRENQNVRDFAEMVQVLYSEVPASEDQPEVVRLIAEVRGPWMWEMEGCCLIDLLSSTREFAAGVTLSWEEIGKLFTFAQSLSDAALKLQNDIMVPLAEKYL